jgi:hypothetical protein
LAVEAAVRAAVRAVEDATDVDAAAAVAVDVAPRQRTRNGSP